MKRIWILLVTIVCLKTLSLSQTIYPHVILYVNDTVVAFLPSQVKDLNRTIVSYQYLQVKDSLSELRIDNLKRKASLRSQQVDLLNSKCEIYESVIQRKNSQLKIKDEMYQDCRKDAQRQKWITVGGICIGVGIGALIGLLIN